MTHVTDRALKPNNQSISVGRPEQLERDVLFSCCFVIYLEGPDIPFRRRNCTSPRLYHIAVHIMIIIIITLIMKYFLSANLQYIPELARCTQKEEEKKEERKKRKARTVQQQ